MVACWQRDLRFTGTVIQPARLRSASMARQELQRTGSLLSLLLKSSAVYPARSLAVVQCGLRIPLNRSFLAPFEICPLPYTPHPMRRQQRIFYTYQWPSIDSQEPPEFIARFPEAYSASLTDEEYAPQHNPFTPPPYTSSLRKAQQALSATLYN